jgi:hypothetical protein
VPLFKRRQKEDPRGAELIERLSARHGELTGAPDPDTPQKLEALWSELGLEFERASDAAWFLKLGEAWSTVFWQGDYHTLHLTFIHEEPSELSLVYLAQNADGLLSWHLVDDYDGEEKLQTRMLVTLAPFDRQVVIAALAAGAREADDLELAQRLNAQVELPADPAVALEAALSELGLESEPLADGPGRAIQTELGPLELQVRFSGELIALSVELERSRQPEDPSVAWWMLKLSAAMARIGVSAHGEEGLWIVTSGFAVPSCGLSPAALAWAMINMLNLARQFATLN